MSWGRVVGNGLPSTPLHFRLEGSMVVSKVHSSNKAPSSSPIPTVETFRPGPTLGVNVFSQRRRRGRHDFAMTTRTGNQGNEREGCLGEPLRNRNTQRMNVCKFETDIKRRVGASGRERQVFVGCTRDREAKHARTLRKRARCGVRASCWVVWGVEEE